MSDPKTIFTHCHICEQTCGIEVRAANNRIVSIKPDKAHPWNWQDFCIKAGRAMDIVHHPARITQPMRREGDRFVPASYEEALDDIGARLRDCLDQNGPDSIGSYIGNPAATVFGGRNFFREMLARIGTRSNFTVSSIDQNAACVVMDKMYGNPQVPLIPDIDRADCFLFIGANPAISMMNWLGKVPNGWRRALARATEGADLIVVDPRLTESARKATKHLAARPDQDWALLLAIIHLLVRSGEPRFTHGHLMAHVEELMQCALAQDVEALSRRCDIPVAEIEDVAARLLRASHPMVIARTGPALGRNGVLTEWLSHVINLLLGAVDVPGGRYMPSWPVSFAELIEGMSRDERVSRVRKLPRVMGQMSVAELPDEILVEGPGQIRSFIMYGGNIVVTGPDGNKLDKALKALDLFVAVDFFQRESHRGAHWLIPGVHFLERDELNVLFWALADRPFIQTGRAAVAPPDGVWPEWKFFLELGRRAGVPMFAGADDPTPEWLARQMLAKGGQVSYDDVVAAEHGLAYGDISYGHLWRFLEERGRRIDLFPPEFGDLLAREMATSYDADPAFPYHLISRRRLNLMNSSMSESVGLLSSDVRSESIEIAQADADALGLMDGDRVSVASRVGKVEAQAIVSKALRPGVVVMEHGWGSGLYDPRTGQQLAKVGANRNLLVSSDDLAPLSAVPRLNGTPVAIRRLGSAGAGEDRGH